MVGGSSARTTICGRSGIGYKQSMHSFGISGVVGNMDPCPLVPQEFGTIFDTKSKEAEEWERLFVKAVMGGETRYPTN